MYLYLLPRKLEDWRCKSPEPTNPSKHLKFQKLLKMSQNFFPFRKRFFSILQNIMGLCYMVALAVNYKTNVKH